MSDLYGGVSNNFNANNNGRGLNEENKKKVIIIAGAAVIGIIVIMIIILAIISSINSKKNNLIIDGASTKIDTTLLYIGENNVPYICVEKLAPKLSYEFYNGEYGTGTEDKAHCYVRNSFEIALLEMDTNIVYKTLVEDKSSTFDTYKMSYNTKRNNNMLYISLPTMQKVFNVKYNYDSENNVLDITTLTSLYKKYNTLAKQKGYYEASGDFSNMKALIQDMVVVISGDRQFGVVSVKDGSSIIGTKYRALTYSEGMGEFIVVQNNKYGVLVRNEHTEASVKVGFEYDSLRVIDNNLGLYLAEVNEKYGVLDKNGKILINLEYDKIGIENPSQFPTDGIKNSYVLYNNCIPVKQGDKWGMFNVLGQNKIPLSKYGFGCIASTSQTAQNLLLIPASEGVEGIVVSIKTEENKIKYGIVDINGTPRTGNRFDSIYKTVSGGKTEYNMLFGNTITSVKERIIDTQGSGDSGGSVQIN